MGGNAFDEPSSRVPSRAELARVASAVKAAVREQCGDKVVVAMPAELADKETFGDVDMHYCFADGVFDPELNAAVLASVYERLGCSERSGYQSAARGHGLVSMLTSEGYQVDLAHIPLQRFALGNLVKSNGDMWWLLNLGLRKVGLVLNEEGLCIRGAMVLPNRIAGNIVLSTEPAQICQFVGLPVEEVWCAAEAPAAENPFGCLGRPLALTRARVFELVSESKFFRAEQVTDYLGRTDQDARKRHDQRPMFAQFAHWLASSGKIVASGLQAAEEDKAQAALCTTDAARDAAERHVLRQAAIVDAAQLFGKAAELAAAMATAASEVEETEFKQQSKARLSGKVVRERHPSLDGPDMGKVLAQLRGESWKLCWNTWLKNASPEDVGRRVDEAVARITADSVSAN